MSYQEIYNIIRRGSLPIINQELTIPLGGETKKAFIQYGFYKNTGSQIIHTHSHAEIHIFLGKATVTVDNCKYDFKNGTIVLIPKSTYHTYELRDGAKHSAFQIAMDAEFAYHSVSPDILRELFHEIEKVWETENYSRISAYLSFLCSYFVTDVEKKKTSKITDYAFLINEFLSLKYIEDIKLSNLAEYLCVSEKQAHRLVIKHTGNTFGNELTTRRMKAAEQLMKDGRFSLTEIAESVGYQTYSGFWKAYRRYKAECEAEK